jgi:hypothetical protein
MVGAVNAVLLINVVDRPRDQVSPVEDDQRRELLAIKRPPVLTPGKRIVVTVVILHEGEGIGIGVHQPA